MLTYTVEELRALDFDHLPPRPVRKILFTFRLWRSARYRRRAAGAGLSGRSRNNEFPRCAKVGQPARRSANCSMDIGWLNVQSLRRKTDTVRQTITEQSLDVLALTETWHNDHDDVCLRLSASTGYAVVDAARKSGRGGGVAVIFRQHLKCSTVSLPAYHTMELTCVRLITASGPVVILNIYRPPSSSERPLSLFFDELRRWSSTRVRLSSVVILICRRRITLT